MSMADVESSWACMSPEEKREHRFNAWLNPPVSFVSSEAESAYKERVRRLIDAICLQKLPDRVPVCTIMGFLPAWYAGLSPYESMHDMKRASEAWVAFNKEFQPDALVSPALNTIPAESLELAGLKNYSWPGHGLGRDLGYQYCEGEFMLAEEYDDLIADPTFFLLRTLLPRMVTAYEGIAHLATPHDMRHLAQAPSHLASWGLPEVQESVERLMASGRVMLQWLRELGEVTERIVADGFPEFWRLGAEAPFDIIGDNLRGTRGIMLDIYQRPEKLLEACERMVEVAFRSVLEKTTPDSLPGVFIPLHKGLDSFMSPQQFSTFYWPTLKKLVLKLIDEGFVPVLFTEGRYNTRLETISDLPKGKVIYWFNNSDVFKAKEILGDVGCIQGNVPVSLLHAGEPSQMTAYCRKLIETVGKGGGFILDFGAGADSGRVENIHAMVRAAKEHGWYR